MKKTRIAISMVAAQFMILTATPGLIRAQSPGPQVAQPSASTTQMDPYAESFAGLTYTDEQKEAISKIRQDIESRKAVVKKTDKLTPDQKDAMLTGYARMEYSQIYDKVLTPAQKKLVSTRIHASRAAAKAEQKKQAPPQ